MDGMKTVLHKFPALHLHRGGFRGVAATRQLDFNWLMGYDIQRPCIVRCAVG
jgi:hypothetical protein